MGDHAVGEYELLFGLLFKALVECHVRQDRDRPDLSDELMFKEFVDQIFRVVVKDPFEHNHALVAQVFVNLQRLVDGLPQAWAERVVEKEDRDGDVLT